MAMMWRDAGVLGAVVLLSTAAGAQQPGARPDSARADTVPADSTRRDTTWVATDSVMAALLRRPGYLITKYSGNVVTFDALTKAFAIAAERGRLAIVEREGQRVVTDSVVVYRDTRRTIDVTGRFEIAAGGGQPPIAGSGAASYNLADRSGRLTNAIVTVPDESGQQWYIQSEIGKTVLGDSTRGIPTRFYGEDATLTSCDDSVQHYHFEVSEFKRRENSMVARPAVFYIRDIPVMWFPFVFQDLRSGRRSGILPPRFGVSDIVRNNPGYRRHVENIGYYWALSDYFDMTAWADWRSSAGASAADPGWYKLNAEWKYTWLTRFLSGRLASSYLQQRDGSTNLAVSWGHQQRFGEYRNLTTNVNYVTSTRLQRQNTFNPYQAMATIRSSFTLSDRIGPAALQVGGDRTQFPGRETVEQTLPTLSLTTAPLALASWLIWTPAFTFRERQSLKMDNPSPLSVIGVAGPDGRIIRRDTVERNLYDRSLTFDTPIRVFGFDFRSGVTINDQVRDYPEDVEVYVDADSARKERRIYARTFQTDVDWSPTIALPQFASNRFKITPTISLSNVDGGSFWTRSHLSGGKFVHQSKRLRYGLSAAPTIYGLFPGFGPFQRIRHQVSPVLQYTIAPRAKISDEYLAARNIRKQNYTGTLPQSSISLGLSQVFEAKVRSANDTSTDPDAGQKIKLLSLQMSPFSYDFERARALGRSLAGLTTENFSANASSDLLPGMDFALNYSLFRGSTSTDTAEFDPFLTSISTSVRINQRENPLAVITRLFGRAVPERSPEPQVGRTATSAEDTQRQREIASMPVAGQASRGTQYMAAASRGFEAQFNFSATRSRPPRPGDRVIESDPRTICEIYRADPFAFDNCFHSPTLDQPPPSSPGAAQIRLPAQTSLSSNINLPITRNWSAMWNTSYDFELRQFASQSVSLQRDLHDFTAYFAFTKSPNGNFAFSFNIALKPQPDLKFDYSRASVRAR